MKGQELLKVRSWPVSFVMSGSSVHSDPEYFDTARLWHFYKLCGYRRLSIDPWDHKSPAAPQD